MPVLDVSTEIAVRRILLATDFSTAAEVASGYAKALACRFGSTVELTNVLNLSSAATSDETLVDEMRQSNSEKLDILYGKFSGVRAHIRALEASSPPEAILAAARDLQADLIVMGTTSKHGLDKLILGTTAERVIRSAPCPVLTIGPHVATPPQAPLAFPAIVYATDFSTPALKASTYALSFAQDSGARLYLCHVLGVTRPKHPQKFALEPSFKASLRHLIPESAYDWCHPECVIEHGDIAEAILGLAERVGAGLIVLGARRDSIWLKYVEDGLTPAILAGARCPVLTVC